MRLVSRSAGSALALSSAAPAAASVLRAAAAFLAGAAISITLPACCHTEPSVNIFFWFSRNSSSSSLWWLD